MANSCNFGQMDNKKAEVIEALKDCHGIVTDACRKADVPRSTFYVWLKDDPDFKAAYEDTLEQAIDFVEGKLFEKINGVTVRKGVDDETGEDIIYDLPPSDTALIFFLKTKAKKRGYVERQEVEHSGNMSITWNEEKTYETKDDKSL